MEIVWLDQELVLAIHARQLAEHGGVEGVRDAGLLASALARPQQTLAYADPPPGLADLAATLTYGLARNHPFSDGNKRTAYIACRVFLLLNGVELAASMDDRYVTMIELAEGELAVEDFAAWLRQHLRPEQVNETAATYREGTATG
jgi:death-on-curing protein